MNNKGLKKPEYIFETSWEVCNKIGGIHTVLSTKAYTLQGLYPDRIIFVGPYIKDRPAADFIADETLLSSWRTEAWNRDRIRVITGRWDIPGRPIVVLVDYRTVKMDMNKIYYNVWEKFGVNSLKANGDYEESCMFAYAAAKTIESFLIYHNLDKKPVIAHFNEWTVGLGALYLRQNMPRTATVFTTHATTIGRSIAGNNRPLYAMMTSCDSDAVAAELNIEAKHSLEKQTAANCDCFTTVSEITAKECTYLLGKQPDIITPNGFEPDIVPSGEDYDKSRREARAILLKTASRLLGSNIDNDAILLSTSGRYEYRNKGLDLFIDALDKLRQSPERLNKEIIAFIMVPAWTKAPRADLQYILERYIELEGPLLYPNTTHWLYNMSEDRVLNYINAKGFTAASNPRIIFIPSYLNGDDGIFNRPYYDLLPGMDMTIYPSYYEPWGYTPLESIAFGVPTITTDLAGFGLWAAEELSGEDDIRQGVKVISRTDDNYFASAEEISKVILELNDGNKADREAIRSQSRTLSEKAAWPKFIHRYEQAYDIALSKAAQRIK